MAEASQMVCEVEGEERRGDQEVVAAMPKEAQIGKLARK